MILLVIYPATAIQVTSSITSNEVYPNEDVSFSLDISKYPLADIRIYIETDLVNPHFSVKGSGEVVIDKQSVEIFNLTDPEFYVEVSGKTPVGKESKYISVFEGGFYATKFDEGPYKYYEVKLLDKDGNVLDRKISTFRLKFKELEHFNSLLGKIKDPEAKHFANDLLESGQYDKAIRFLEIISANQTQSPVLLLISGLGGLLMGLLVGLKIGRKEGGKVKREGEYPE